MRVVESVLLGAWAAFWIYWLVAAARAKRGRIAWSRELRLRVALAVVVLLLLRVGVFRHGDPHTRPWREAVGLVLVAAGLGFAVWARRHIGRNWGAPMSQKDDPELVTSGPYGLVRHPIYTGILTGLVGTAVALSWTWLVVAVLAGAYFVYAATVEERNMTERFPDAYPAYRARTKMLVPFVF